MSLSKLGGLILVACIAAPPITPACQNRAQTVKVTFEVVPVKTVFHPNEPIVLRLVLTNRGESSVTVERFSRLCSSDFFVFVDLRILDANGQEAQQAGCAADFFPSQEFLERVVSEVGKTDDWIKLDPNDLYGEETARTVKTRKGAYTIKAEFLPARIPEEDTEVLAQRGITVLPGKITAPIVKIVVR
ncbi:MAG: hypothetical protein LAO78_16295 [Acidobacteriia bacterium]|nr:hypothetical protein [Terriglobia bacterium]